MSTTVSLHLARANKAVQLLAEACTEEEAALLIDAGMKELEAAVAAAPPSLAERVQTLVNDIAERLFRFVNPDVMAEALASV